MSATTHAPVVAKRRVDYSPPDYTIDTVYLQFDLSPSSTSVCGTFSVRRLNSQAKSIILDGKSLELHSVHLNENQLEKGKDYQQSETDLEIFTELSEFELRIENSITPDKNTSLEGLYYTNNAFCTQCEAQGFRKIIYFLDRPDVLAKYTVEITSTDKNHTYLLSNGNLKSDTGFTNGSRTCVWEDPFPKPAYLFALVAGHFDKLSDTFTTQSGKQVALELFVDEGRMHQGQHALDSLKKAMKWDEEKYGLQYDLQIYMVVAVDFFNMGAMENKGLNVFNSKYVLADESTATDEDYFNIESVIAHEYFHNWTGNRVTCRDWFQLSLKEGLTVFRDQQFSADMYSQLVTRISQVNVMREHQFPEDAGPMSHPIRPDVVMEMNNFYTVTVYDKGAEVIRMLHTLLGEDGFRQGIDLYFQRHDGQAVTCDDFVSAMQDANNHDLSHFARWYSQSGTPEITVTQTPIDDKFYELSFSQHISKSASGNDKQALYIPIKLECFSAEGKKVDLSLDMDTFVLDKPSASIKVCATEKLTLSLLQDFSAPVKINYQHNSEDLLIILQHAQNHYAKWEAVQSLYKDLIVHIYKQYNEHSNINELVDDSVISTPVSTLYSYLQKADLPLEVKAELLRVPSTESMFSQMQDVDPLALNQARKAFVEYLSDITHEYCLNTYKDLTSVLSQQRYAYDKAQVNARKLKNTCLNLLASGKTNSNVDGLIRTQFDHSKNMTDTLSALSSAALANDDLFDGLMTAFESKFGHDAVVMDKWFAMHAKKPSSDILSQLDLLQAHKQFTVQNPNKVRSLIGTFAFYNIQGFHQQSGAGYRYLADYIIQLDAINPQVAARLITPLLQFSCFKADTQALMKTQLERIFGRKGLSNDLFEKLSKALT